MREFRILRRSRAKKQDCNHRFQEKRLQPLQRAVCKDPKGYHRGGKKDGRDMVLQPEERFIPTSRKSSKGIRKPACIVRMSYLYSDIKVCRGWKQEQVTQ